MGGSGHTGCPLWVPPFARHTPSVQGCTLPDSGVTSLERWRVRVRTRVLWGGNFNRLSIYPSRPHCGALSEGSLCTPQPPALGGTCYCLGGPFMHPLCSPCYCGLGAPGNKRELSCLGTRWCEERTHGERT